ncbi:MAG: hypothetical protein QM784_16555 [Polyangiaceae bacterium]
MNDTKDIEHFGSSDGPHRPELVREALPAAADTAKVDASGFAVSAAKVADNSGDHAGEARELRSVLKSVFVVGVLATTCVTFGFGPLGGISAGFGALLGFGNLLLLGRMVRAFVSRNGVSMPWVMAALLKLAALFLAMYLPVRAGILELLPFVLGFGALPVGIVASQFLSVPTQSKAN